jgi:hypothetical protein
LAWTSIGSSPISSRNSVPPSAARTLPSTRRVAVECAPGSAPNSSLSTSSRGRAAQFSSTNGLSRRLLLSWITRLSADFPVPVGPVSNTGRSRSATRAVSRRVSAIAALRPMIDSARSRLRHGSVGSGDARRRASRSRTAAGATCSAKVRRVSRSSDENPPGCVRPLQEDDADPAGEGRTNDLLDRSAADALAGREPRIRDGRRRMDDPPRCGASPRGCRRPPTPEWRRSRRLRTRARPSRCPRRRAARRGRAPPRSRRSRTSTSARPGSPRRRPPASREGLDTSHVHGAAGRSRPCSHGTRWRARGRPPIGGRRGHRDPLAVAPAAASRGGARPRQRRTDHSS